MPSKPSASRCLHRPEDPKYVVCVSSQVGCAMACEFCATGRMGFRGNLAAWEIVDQVVKIQADSPHPVRGVVFMGMGEPMLNYVNVMQAATILSESCGMAIAGKAITISTVGIVPGIRRFTAQRQRFRLVVSLTSADAEVRRSLMPIEETYTTPQLMEALREYHEATHRRVTLAWIMISGVNTRDEDAAQLAELTRGLPVKLDLDRRERSNGPVSAAVARGVASLSRRPDGPAGRAGRSSLQRRQGYPCRLRDVGRKAGASRRNQLIDFVGWTSESVPKNRRTRRSILRKTTRVVLTRPLR